MSNMNKSYFIVWKTIKMSLNNKNNKEVSEHPLGRSLVKVREAAGLRAQQEGAQPCHGSSHNRNYFMSHGSLAEGSLPFSRANYF